MRYLLIAGLLLLPLATWAAQTSSSDTCGVTLTIPQYVWVDAGNDITCTATEGQGGAGTFSGTGAATVKANCNWAISEGTPNLLLQKAGAPDIDPTVSFNPASGGPTGSAGASVTISVSGSYTIENHAGDYSGTLIVNVTAS